MGALPSLRRGLPKPRPPKPRPKLASRRRRCQLLVVAIRLAKLFATARSAEIDATIMVGNTVSRSTYVHRAGRVETSRLFLSTLAYQRLQILSQWRHLRDRWRHPLQPQVLQTSPMLLGRLGKQLRRWLPTANESAQSANTRSSSTNGATTIILLRIPDGAGSAAEYVRDLVAK